MVKAKSIDMCNGPLLKKMFSYTVPIILSSILQLLFNAADLVVVGRYCGSNSVAAVGATNSIINLTVCLFVGLSIGAGVIVAQNLGARNKQGVFEAVHTAVPLALVGGLVLTAVGITFSSNFLQWMGTPAEGGILHYSTIYIQIYFTGAISLLIYNFGAAILRAVGDTKSPLIYLFTAGVINVILNIIFVKYFNLNVAGVALATAISQTVSALLVLRCLIKRDDDCKLNLKRMHFNGKMVFSIIRIGIPSGLQGAMFSLSNVIIQSSVNSLGTAVISGDAAAKNIEGFIFISMNAYHQTAVNFTGQNVGAGKFDRVRKILLQNILMVSVTGILLSGTAILLGKELLSIYITDSALAVKYGYIRLFITCCAYFTCGIMDVFNGTLRGMGASSTPMIISVFGVCGIRILWIFTVFAHYRTLECLSLSYPISWIITVLADIIAYIIVKRRLKAKMQLST